MKCVKCLFVVVILFVLMNVKLVKADSSVTIGRGYLKGYYYVISESDSLEYFQFPIYSINNCVAYSIEFGAPITMWIYSGKEGFINSPYEDEVNSKIELIGHYGYEYLERKDLKYRIATQVLIWEVANNKKLEIYTDINGDYEKINIDSEKEEIINLVNNHYVKSSFDNEFIIDNLNAEIVLKDANNVLSKYEVYDDGGNLVRIEDNSLYVKLIASGKSNVELRRKKYDDAKTMIFVGKGLESQKLGIFRNYVQDSVIVNLESVDLKLKIIAVDSETKSNINVGGLKFKIKNLDSDKYICENEECIFETDENGIIMIENVCRGNYQIEELENLQLDNYLWNSEHLVFSIDEESIINDGIYEINFNKKRSKGMVEINLIGEQVIFSEDTYHYKDVILENAVFGLYALEDIYVLDKIKYKKDELIGKLRTNEFGYASFDNLELGKYYVKQISSSLGNIVDNTKYLFELKYKDQYTGVVCVILDLKNILAKGSLEFISSNLDSGFSISNNLIEIYSSLDNKIVYSGYTDEDGKIIVSNLPLGKYYIKEKDKEIVNFDITENNEIVKVGFTNEIVAEVPNTMLNEIDMILILGIILIVIGLGWYLYVKKK